MINKKVTQSELYLMMLEWEINKRTSEPTSQVEITIL